MWKEAEQIASTLSLSTGEIALIEVSLCPVRLLGPGNPSKCQGSGQKPSPGQMSNA